ncbi:MAG: ABC transporter ATP-binding protein [Candidatus Eisenbacteria bacterium]
MRHVVKTLVWPRRKLLLLGLGLILINRLCGLVLPGSTKYLVDKVIAQKDMHMLRLLVVAVGGAVGIQAVTGFLLTKLLSVEAHELIRQLRIQIQRHVIRLPVGYFDSTKSGVLVSRVMDDVEGIRNLIGTGLVQLIGGVLTSAVALVLVLSISPLMTLLALVPLILFAFISMRAFRTIRPIFRDRGAIRAAVTGRLTESFGGVRVIKGFNAESREEEVFADGARQIFENVKKTLTTTALVTSAATLLLGVASVTIMGMGGGLIIQDKLTLGDFFAFTLYLGFLVAPIVQMANIGTQITEAFAGLDRMDELMAMGREEDDPSRTAELSVVRGDIVFEDVRFEYEADKEILHGISFRAAPGSVTALVGSSGSGKTTLAGLAASFLVPSSGIVRVDGVDLSTVRLGTYRNRLGVVLQDDFLFEGTIRENVLFSKPDASEDELTAAVASAYVSEFTDRFEKGLDTVIGERGVKLSGGQRQRVAIARALLADPRVLILDEATSNLDAESESYIQKSLKVLMEGRTTFVIAHRLSTIRSADQILVIESGRILEQGNHDELLARQGRYYELYTYQARI